MSSRRTFVRKYPIGKEATALKRRFRRTMPQKDVTDLWRGKSFMKLIDAIQTKAVRMVVKDKKIRGVPKEVVMLDEKQ